MQARRISTITGTREQRAAVHAQRAAAQRQAALSRMTPEQRTKALAQESQAKESQAAQAHAQRNEKLVNTKAMSGSKAEREQFRADRQAALRETALSRMTPEQKEKALAQESAAKESQAAKAKAQEDDKARRTVGKVGSKEEREAHRADKQRVRREDMLKGMTPEQRERALAQEAAAKDAEAAKVQAKADDKIRRTVAIVGDDKEREEHHTERARVHREDMLSRMTPDEQQRALAQEAAAKAAQALKDQQEKAAKEARTVAVVGNQERRDAFGPPPAPRGTPTFHEPAGLRLSADALRHELHALSSTSLAFAA